VFKIESVGKKRIAFSKLGKIPFLGEESVFYQKERGVST
jgi:hypothetical protein